MNDSLKTENIYEVHSKLLNADENTFTEKELMNYFDKYNEKLNSLNEDDYSSIYCELAIINEIIFLLKPEKINQEQTKIKFLIENLAKLLKYYYENKTDDIFIQYSKIIIGTSEKIAEKSEELSQYLAINQILRGAINFLKSKTLLIPIINSDSLNEDSLSLYDRIVFFIFKISFWSINKEELRGKKVEIIISEEFESLNLMIKKYENFRRIFEINKSRLAFIIVRMLDENEVEKLDYKNQIVETIVQLLNEIIDSKQDKIHFSSNFYISYDISNLSTYISASSQLQQLVTLASNDQLKEQVFDLIGFDRLMILISEGNTEEIQYSLELLSSLCFNKKIKKNISELFPVIKQKLTEKEKISEMEKLDFILFNTEKKLKINSRQKNDLQIMISYNHKYKDYCKKINEELKRLGYKTWIDLEKMSSNIIDGMANAIETSTVIIVCYSTEYKESSNCRAELEYAFSNGKKLVPVRMQQKYRPDGWLGLSKFKHDSILTFYNALFFSPRRQTLY
jgi:hypothetical protein